MLLVVALLSCNDETKVRRVVLYPSGMTLSVGESRQIEMIIEPLSAAIHNQTAWHTSDPDVAQVDDEGRVTAIDAGKCVITGQANHVEATCTVEVVTPTYNIGMPRAVVWNDGVDAGSGTANRLAVRMHEETLSVDSTGGIDGTGMLLNLSLYAPISAEVVPTGSYTTSTTTGTEYSIEPGAIIDENGSRYASGSFFGQYTEHGLSVVLIKEGTVTVENDSVCHVRCSLKGDNNEHIDASYSGTPRSYNTATESELSTLYYTGASTQKVDIAGEYAVDHVRFTFTTPSDTVVTLTARVPLSATMPPVGVYTTSATAHTFTLTTEEHQSPGLIVADNDTSVVSSGTLHILSSENAFSYRASLTDQSKRQYLLIPLKEKVQYIKPLKITSALR